MEGKGAMKGKGYTSNKISSYAGPFMMTPDAPPFRPAFLPARASSRRAMEAHEREPVVLAGSSARDRTLTPRPGK
eukprot:602596-Prorocentrum_lima.AAC.1